MFKRMILTLRGNIEFFCFHKRHEIVLQILWSIYHQKNFKLSNEQRRNNLIKMIVSISEKEE